MGVAKVTRNYQVTIPRDVRIMQSIHVGDTIVFSVEGERVEILKLKEDILEKAFGSWKEMKETGTDYVKRIRTEWETREKRIRRQK